MDKTANMHVKKKKVEHPYAEPRMQCKQKIDFMAVDAG